MVIEPTLVEDATSHLQIIMPFTYRKSVDTGQTKNIFFYDESRINEMWSVDSPISIRFQCRFALISYNHYTCRRKSLTSNITQLKIFGMC